MMNISEKKLKRTINEAFKKKLQFNTRELQILEWCISLAYNDRPKKMIYDMSKLQKKVRSQMNSKDYDKNVYSEMDKNEEY